MTVHKSLDGDQLKRFFFRCPRVRNCLFLNCVFACAFFWVKTRSERMQFNQSGLHLFFFLHEVQKEKRPKLSMVLEECNQNED